MAGRRITEEDRVEAKRLILAALASHLDLEVASLAIAELHVRGDTFPGEVFMGLAADALDIAGVDRSDPIDYDSLLHDYLADVSFRGKQHHKISYAVHASAALQGGLAPDLLDEVPYWIDDYWRYAMYATIALTRASAAKSNVEVAELAERIAQRHDLALN